MTFDEVHAICARLWNSTGKYDKSKMYDLVLSVSEVSDETKIWALEQIDRAFEGTWLRDWQWTAQSVNCIRGEYHRLTGRDPF